MRSLALLVGFFGFGYHWLFATPEMPEKVAKEVPQHWIRVGLRQGITRVALSCPAGLQFLDASGATVLEGVTAAKVSEDWNGENGPRLLLAAAVSDAPAENSQSLPLAALKVRAADSQTPIDTGEGRYRGLLVLEPDRRSRLSLVNSLPIDDYLRGVVPAEMEASAPLGALKAQAIVARTFAVASLARHEAEGFNLCDSVHCQVYRGADGEQEASDRAVAETRGQVLLYQGRPITAYFHSTCGGVTDSPADVWGEGGAPPYLKGEPDTARDLGEDLSAETGILSLAARTEDVFCGDSPEFYWEIERSRGELARLLARTLPAVLEKSAPLGSLENLTVEGRTASGRAVALRVQGSAGTYTVRGDSIRWLFGSGSADTKGLHSTRFVIRPIREGADPQAPPVRYRLLGFGWGHGIGLCQAGAMGMARHGYGTAEIMRHYYPGTALGSLDNLPQ